MTTVRPPLVEEAPPAAFAGGELAPRPTTPERRLAGDAHAAAIETLIAALEDHDAAAAAPTKRRAPEDQQP